MDGIRSSSQSISKLKKKSKDHTEWLWAYFFIFPMLAGVLIFSIWPILYSFYMSLTNWTGLSPGTFIGFENFMTLLTDEKMHYEIINTLIYTVTTVPIALILSLAVAYLLNKGLKTTGFFRVVYFMPNIMMPVAVAMIWRCLFNSKYGLINIILKALLLPAPMWISDPRYVLTALIIISIWSSIGYNAVILLAGLQGISQSLYEAADIDGAGEFTKFYKITVPLLTPSIFFLLTMNIMNALRVFDIVYTFTGAGVTSGGPLLDASRSIVYGIIEKAFTYHEMGLASAESVVLFLFIAVVTVIQFVFQKKWVFYE